MAAMAEKHACDVLGVAGNPFPVPLALYYARRRGDLFNL